MDVEPNDLLLFARIVEAGSFSQAALRVGLPKSTVSRRIALLEAKLGERLLQRTTRKLMLTEFGASLLDHARKVVEEVEAAGALVQHRQQAPRGRLRISMPADFASLGMTQVMTHFMAQYPAITLELDLSPRRVDLVSENFDIAIRMGDLPDDASLNARRVALEQMALYAAPSYIALRGLPEHPDDLLAHDLLCLLSQGGGPSPWKLTRGKTVWERALPGRLTANSPDLLTRVACAGAGIAASSDLFAAPFVARGDLVRVLPEWDLPLVTGWAVFPGRRLMPAKTRAFLDMMESLCCADARKRMGLV
ncbi:LysR family transcriptional regulator [Massilia sp. P8910]|uniref:LysR family transcriptional regulator n=1 Tax=Massilia antarctica TaxID=2765360 RepID=UPI0006BB8E88|nr:MULTISPECIES: LysR family transcriptional regulator [Massilia]MCE3604068.1 LysR family transcriptional regulator [Massilia antarctica]MCY0910536.1 LysR family transcriptional regulator [Massilia sp. H27-R4]CUI09107.1 Transcriptional regulator, LysR family [Janthinobacterium sp. CG23_2]CUU32893.1 Transcriptional regulator, LysR family [Janthinobacterium sp. CG23_2]